MIKANELRIGNWINFTYTHKKEKLSRQCKVMRLDDTGDIIVNDKGDRLELRGEAAQPIPLSPEILLAFGFTTDEGKIEYSIGLPIGNGSDLFIEDEGHPCMSCGIKSDGKFQYFKDINYLHRLQNLYFALCGQELTQNEIK